MVIRGVQSGGTFHANEMLPCFCMMKRRCDLDGCDGIHVRRVGVRIPFFFFSSTCLSRSEVVWWALIISCALCVDWLVCDIGCIGSAKSFHTVEMRCLEVVALFTVV